MSLDGYIGSGTQARLMLSNDEDLDRVDAVRASSDAILVGAATVRADNPRLLVRSADRRDERRSRGVVESPLRVTVTRSGELDPRAALFTTEGADTVVYCPSDVAAAVRERLPARVQVAGLGPEVDLAQVGQDLGARGVERLLVEGGADVLTQFLTAGLADQLDLVVAPFFVGAPEARRFVGTGPFPWSAQQRAGLGDVRRIGDVVLLQYALSERYGAS